MRALHLPELGENITKATVSYWYVDEGALIEEGQDLVEVSTDKATFNVPAPCSGALIEIVAHEGDVVKVGDALGTMEESDTEEDLSEGDKEL